MADKKYRTPADVKKKDLKVPISARVSPEIKEYFESQAKKEKLTVSLLIEAALEDYVEYMTGKKK